MFLQSGLGYRFRYSRTNVEPDLFLNPERLIGRKGYLIHAHTSENPKPPDTIHEFLPIREATVRDARAFGEFLWIYFEVGGWICYSRNEVADQNEHHLEVQDATPSDSRSFLKFTLYESAGLNLRTIADDPSGKSEEVMQNWIRIVKEMAKFPDHAQRKPSYLKMISIKAKECENLLLPVMLSDSERGYKIRSDTDYRIETFQYNPHGVPSKPFPFRLVVDEKRIIPLIGEATILGRYDFFTLYFRPSATLRSYGTILGFQVDTETDMKLSVRIHAKILRGFGQLLGAIAVAISIGFASLIKEIIQGTITGWSVLYGVGFAVLSFIGLFYSSRSRE
jgi:hypothetical protein